MSTTPGAYIQQVLGEIRDCCKELHAITRRLLSDFSLSALEETIRERSLLLGKIDTEKTHLQGVADRNFWSGYDQYREARAHIDAINALDREVTSQVMDRLSNIRYELSALSGASNAAKTYIRHSRR